MNDTQGDDHAVDGAEYVIEYFNIGVAGRQRRAGVGHRQEDPMRRWDNNPSHPDRTGYYARAT